VADEPGGVRKDVRVSAHVAGALAVDDRRGGEVDLGVIDRERLADLSAGSRGERAMRQNGERGLVAVGDRPLGGPEAARVR